MKFIITKEKLAEIHSQAYELLEDLYRDEIESLKKELKKAQRIIKFLSQK